MPTDSTKKLPTLERGVSKILKNCRRRLWMVPYKRHTSCSLQHHTLHRQTRIVAMSLSYHCCSNYIHPLVCDIITISDQKSKFRRYSAKYESYQTLATSYKSALRTWLLEEIVRSGKTISCRGCFRSEGTGGFSFL